MNIPNSKVFLKGEWSITRSHPLLDACNPIGLVDAKAGLTQAMFNSLFQFLYFYTFLGRSLQILSGSIVVSVSEVLKERTGKNTETKL